jgi:hypothetical protein
VVRHKLAPLVTVLRDGTVVLVDIDGAVVPRWVWYAGDWTFYRDDRRGVEWLEVRTEEGATVKYYIPTFARPAAEEKPARSEKRGNARYDDTAVVELARAEYAAMVKPSKRGAAAAVVDRLITEGMVEDTARKAWIDRIRKQL